MKFLLKHVLWVINIGLMALLIMSYLSPWLSPALWWPMAFAGLAAPVLIILNLLFMIFWLISAKLRFLAPGLLLFLGIPYYNRLYQFGKSTMPEEQTHLTVASMNVRGFGYGKEVYVDSIVNELKTDPPDFLCFQEFWKRKYKAGSSLDITNLFKEEFGFYTYRFNGIGKRSEGFGTIVFTKYKAAAHGDFDFGGFTHNGAAWLDAVIAPGDTIRVYSVHLKSNRLGKDEEMNAADITEKEVVVKKSKSIIRRLKDGFLERSNQVDELAQHIAQCPYPVIIAGDFNDTPLSYTYRKLAKGKKDAFSESGKGMGTTYAGPFPSYRIDYILFDKAFKGSHFKTGSHFGSDHRLISTRIYR